MEKVSKSIAETREIANEFLKSIDAGKENKKHATMVGLHGDLGSGKTAFVKQVADVLSIKETVTSPTFVLMRKYNLINTPHSTFCALIHIDAYRLENGKDLEILGWKEIAANPENLIFIEWPERVKDILPSDMMDIRFEFVDEDTREIVF